MSDAGTDANRTVKLTDRALTILLQEPGSETWMQAVRDAAMSPKIYADLLNKWPAHELPSDTSLQFYLVKDRNFNPSTVVDFLKDFRATVAFAKLDTQPNTSQLEELSPFAGGREEADTMQATGTITPAYSFRAPAPGIKQDVFSLDEGQVVLQWPAKMSAASYRDFKDWIDLQVRKIARAVESGSPPSA